MDDKKKKELLNQIINQIGEERTISLTRLLESYIDDYTFIASNESNRNINDNKIIPYVKKAVISAYNRLGVEGMKSSTEGSQSYSFEDIEEKLAKDVRSIRLLS